jgi:SAM-dependent methyltransferase
MSRTPSHRSDFRAALLGDLLGLHSLTDGEHVTVRDIPLVVRDGMIRGQQLVSDAQRQTREAFGFKWQRRDTYESATIRERLSAWLVERYGEIKVDGWLAQHGNRPLLLDAGCGAGLSGLTLFGPLLDRIRYLGVDISPAVDIARKRFEEARNPGLFMQLDLMQLPFPPGSIDIIFSEGVLHHTDSTEQALKRLSKLLKPGGRFLFYVYRKKGPIREFTDDYLREALQPMTPSQAWDALMPLTKLGKALGELDIEIDVPESIELLRIPAGRINLQRLFYWHVFKAFYRPEMTLDEMNHTNFDWYAPRNAHRQTLAEVRRWCEEADLIIDREREEDAGITITAHRAAR